MVALDMHLFDLHKMVMLKWHLKQGQDIFTKYGGRNTKSDWGGSIKPNVTTYYTFKI